MLNKAFFSPGSECLEAIRSRLLSTEFEALVCVFTISDDRLTETLLELHQRGIELRIVTDNDKVFDKGSDIRLLAHRGVPVHVDRSEHHMHHKFLVSDRRYVLTGSYNWTRTAEFANRENVVEIDDPLLAERFAEEFERIWKQGRRWR
jgi:phosphatidylserine/phosphatidylglycerophosphate/cardiolipin synthase-like enzyme